MATDVYVKNSFNGGEISPKLFGRQDIDTYNSSLAEATNTNIKNYGAIQRRNGFKYITTVKNSDNTVRLLKFQFSVEDAFVIEIGNLYVRFLKGGEIVYKDEIVYEISSPYTDEDLQELTYVQYGNDIYIAHPSYAPRILTRIQDNEWTLKELELSPPPTVEIGFYPPATVTPDAVSGFLVNFTASADAFLVGDVGRQIINEAGEGKATITGVSSATVAICDIVETFDNTNPIAIGDWKLDTSPQSDLDPSASISGSILNIASYGLSSESLINVFRSSDVGRFILINNGTIRITRYNNAQSVDGVIQKSLTDTTKSSIWSLEDLEWTDERGYPRAVSFFESRLWFAGTDEAPLTLWASEVDIYTGFGKGANDVDAIDVKASSASANRLSWLASSRELIVGSIGSEFSVAKGVTPSNVHENQKSLTSYGSETQQPMFIGSEIVFIQSTKTKLRTFGYSFDIDSYTGQDLLYLTDSLAKKKLKSAVYAQHPDTSIYAVTEDGDLLVATYDITQKILGWSRWETQGYFKDIMAIDYGNTSLVHVLVERTVDGNKKQYIEILDTGEGFDYTDIFSDSAIVYSKPIPISGIERGTTTKIITEEPHNLVNEDTIQMVDIVGTTTLNNKNYLVARSTAITFELEQISDRVSLVNTELEWTISSSGTDEYYLTNTSGEDTGINLELAISLYYGGTLMTEGTAGTLADGEWDYVDNDTLGFKTIYVRLLGAIKDPDDSGNGSIQYALSIDSTNYNKYISSGEVHLMVDKITGLEHLEGLVVQVKSDGGTSKKATVSSGAINLAVKAYDVVVGLEYTTTIKTLPANWLNMKMQGRQSSSVHTLIRVTNSSLPKVNDSFLPDRNTADVMNTPVPLYTGILDYGNTNDWSATVQFKISYSDGLPIVLLAIYSKVVGYVG